VWNREGKLVGEIDRQDPESAWKNWALPNRRQAPMLNRVVLDVRWSRSIIDLDSLILIRNNRLVAASASSLRTRRTAGTQRTAGGVLMENYTNGARGYVAAVVYNVSTLSLHKPLSSLSERIHREAVRCLAHVSGPFGEPPRQEMNWRYDTHNTDILR